MKGSTLERSLCWLGQCPHVGSGYDWYRYDREVRVSGPLYSKMLAQAHWKTGFSCKHLEQTLGSSGAIVNPKSLTLRPSKFSKPNAKN